MAHPYCGGSQPLIEAKLYATKTLLIPQATTTTATTTTTGNRPRDETTGAQQILQDPFGLQIRYILHKLHSQTIFSYPVD